MLQLRSDNESWGLPGGTMELGESFEEAATREVYEETNLEIQNLKFITNFQVKIITWSIQMEIKHIL